MEKNEQAGPDSKVTDLGSRKTRTPRNYESILNGAKSLTLVEKVSLVKELKADIQAEVDSMSKVVADVVATVNGL